MDSIMGDLKIAIEAIIDVDKERHQIYSEDPVDLDKLYELTHRFNKAMSQLKEEYRLYFVEPEDDPEFTNWQNEGGL